MRRLPAHRRERHNGYSTHHWISAIATPTHGKAFIRGFSPYAYLPSLNITNDIYRSLATVLPALAHESPLSHFLTRTFSYRRIRATDTSINLVSPLCQSRSRDQFSSSPASRVPSRACLESFYRSLSRSLPSGATYYCYVFPLGFGALVLTFSLCSCSLLAADTLPLALLKLRQYAHFANFTRYNIIS